ncbi:hypothetical protein TrCOL_g12845 [Triparma columacea]|uniref:Uncharacterized protein n=1 Tax=Triparma columacea TaxID=722753 RepID=A0A9W7LB00_9STRA|nr:hypothetical protein TrCOL_g12845 [Triparma columacea]
MSELDFAYGDDYSDDDGDYYSDDDGDDDGYDEGDVYSNDYDDQDDGDSPLPKTAVYSGTGNFRGNRELTEVTFVQGVTSIGEGVFYRCSSLTAITIPDGVTTICEDAFYRCSSLTAITIPDSVTTIGERAFHGCSALTKLILSPAVSIGEDCFLNCTALISAAASQNMPNVEALLRSRWHRIRSRVNALLCLKGTWIDDLENQPGSDNNGDKVGALQGAVARQLLPKVMWRVILEFL